MYRAGMVCTVLPPLFLFCLPIVAEFPVKVSDGPPQPLIALIGGGITLCRCGTRIEPVGWRVIPNGRDNVVAPIPLCIRRGTS